MAVRLAFAVAAHLEPEILIVDEVLAVGDASFQKKCINKMQDVSREGRTVLFVSHNMPAVSMLCSRAVLLSGGRVEIDGPAHQVISHYLNAGEGGASSREWHDPSTAPGGNVARLRAIRIVDRGSKPVSSVDIRESVGLQMTFEVLQPGFKLLPHYWVYNEEGAMIFAVNHTDPDWTQRPYATGVYVTTAWIPGNFLAPGMLFVTPALITQSPKTVQFDEPQVIVFRVRDNMGADTARGEWAGDMPGVVRPMLQWTTETGGSSRSETAAELRLGSLCHECSA